MASDHILIQLHQIGEKMEARDRRVQRTVLHRVALLPTASQDHSEHDMVSHGIEAEPVSCQSVVPSMTYRLSNELVPCEVAKGLAELRNLNERATKGRDESQGWGSGGAFHFDGYTQNSSKF